MKISVGVICKCPICATLTSLRALRSLREQSVLSLGNKGGQIIWMSELRHRRICRVESNFRFNKASALSVVGFEHSSGQ